MNMYVLPRRQEGPAPSHCWHALARFFRVEGRGQGTTVAWPVWQRRMASREVRQQFLAACVIHRRGCVGRTLAAVKRTPRTRTRAGTSGAGAVRPGTSVADLSAIVSCSYGGVVVPKATGGSNLLWSETELEGDPAGPKQAIRIVCVAPSSGAAPRVKATGLHRRLRMRSSMRSGDFSLRLASGLVPVANAGGDQASLPGLRDDLCATVQGRSSTPGAVTARRPFVILLHTCCWTQMNQANWGCEAELTVCYMQCPCVRTPLHCNWIKPMRIEVACPLEGQPEQTPRWPRRLCCRCCSHLQSHETLNTSCYSNNAPSLRRPAPQHEVLVESHRGCGLPRHEWTSGGCMRNG